MGWGGGGGRGSDSAGLEVRQQQSISTYLYNIMCLRYVAENNEKHNDKNYAVKVFFWSSMPLLSLENLHISSWDFSSSFFCCVLIVKIGTVLFIHAQNCINMYVNNVSVQVIFLLNSKRILELRFYRLEVTKITVSAGFYVSSDRFYPLHLSTDATHNDNQFQSVTCFWRKTAECSSFLATPSMGRGGRPQQQFSTTMRSTAARWSRCRLRAALPRPPPPQRRPSRPSSRGPRNGSGRAAPAWKSRGRTPGTRLFRRGWRGREAARWAVATARRTAPNAPPQLLCPVRDGTFGRASERRERGGGLVAKKKWRET